MLVVTDDPVDDVVRQACAFWSSLVRNNTLCKELLDKEDDVEGEGQSELKRSRPDTEAAPPVKVTRLERLLNSLVKRVQLINWDLSLEYNGLNLNIPDDPQDVSPRFYRGGYVEKEDYLLLDGAVSEWNLSKVRFVILLF